MKERPVIFNGEMVRAIIDGRKTQTRRIAKADSSNHLLSCPFGKVGDRLWVRETWQGPLVAEEHLEDYRVNADKFQTPEFCEYAADGGPRPEFCDLDDNARQGWRPSIHMPRWASRITLEITAVRVEKLQDISEADAIAEGGTEHFNIDWFGPLWASIYGVDSWNANPWVWVIEFRRVGGA